MDVQSVYLCQQNAIALLERRWQADNHRQSIPGQDRESNSYVIIYWDTVILPRVGSSELILSRVDWSQCMQCKKCLFIIIWRQLKLFTSLVNFGKRSTNMHIHYHENFSYRYNVKRFTKLCNLYTRNSISISHIAINWLCNVVSSYALAKLCRDQPTWIFVGKKFLQQSSAKLLSEISQTPSGKITVSVLLEKWPHPRSVVAYSAEVAHHAVPTVTVTEEFVVRPLHLVRWRITQSNCRV